MDKAGRARFGNAEAFCYVEGIETRTEKLKGGRVTEGGRGGINLPPRGLGCREAISSRMERVSDGKSSKGVCGFGCRSRRSSRWERCGIGELSGEHSGLPSDGAGYLSRCIFLMQEVAAPLWYGLRVRKPASTRISFDVIGYLCATFSFSKDRLGNSPLGRPFRAIESHVHREVAVALEEILRRFPHIIRNTLTHAAHLPA